MQRRTAIFSIAVIFGIGCLLIPWAHNKLSTSAHSSQMLKTAKSLVLACRVHAGDHEGRWPDHLGEIAEEIGGHATLKNLGFRVAHNANPEPWLYIPPGALAPHPGQPVIVSPQMIAGKWTVVVYGDGSGEVAKTTKKF